MKNVPIEQLESSTDRAQHPRPTNYISRRRSQRSRSTTGRVKPILSWLVFCASMFAASGAWAKIATDISASVSPDPLIVGQPARVTVTVTPHTPTSLVPTGLITVTWGNDGCTFTLPAKSCVFTPSVKSADNYIVFDYEGDANFDGNGNGFSKVSVIGSKTNLKSSPNPSVPGQAVTFTALVSGSSPTGKVTFKDASSALCSNVTLAGVTATCTVKSLSAGNHAIAANYFGDSNNSSSISTLTQAVVSSSVEIDQHGLTGSWYDPQNSGQGFVFEIYPDKNGVGNALFAGSWFTFDVAPAGGEEKLRWYTLSGNASSASESASLNIYATEGGNFNAPPTVSAVAIGQATIAFSDCNTAVFNYAFNDGSNRSGTITLSRLTANTTCASTGDNGAAAGKYLLSGFWYTPATSGQGMMLDINPGQNIFSASWYTYAVNGQAIGGAASQRWYFFQAPLGTSNTISNAPIYATTGGIFRDPTSVTRTQVGSGTFVLSSCSSITVSYTFTGGSESGKSGTIVMQRAGPIPAGCAL